jgi:hypothetical protein
MKKRLKEPSDELRELIALVNGLPQGARTTVELSVGTSRTEQEVRSQRKAAMRRRLAGGYFDSPTEQDAFVRVMEQLPASVIEFIGAANDPQSLDPQALAANLASRNRYDTLVVAQKLLQEVGEINDYILEFFKEEGRPINEASLCQSWLRLDFERSVDAHAGLTSLAPDNECKARWKSGFLTQALDGAELARIRLCPICSSFFWAKRMNATCCCTEHAHRLRSRRWTERYPDRYKKRRIERAEARETRTNAETQVHIKDGRG